MTLHQDIQQKEFRNEYHKAILNLLHTHNFVVSKMDEVFSLFDITRQQYNVLRIVRGQHPGHASVNLIRDRMIEKMSDASRLVERLRLKGFLTRQGSDKDKRAVKIMITQKGLDLLQNMEKSVQGFETLFSGLSVTEAKRLNDMLDKIREKKE